MASESSSRSSSAADSYIGSLISLTSKSEIRYEGVLYNINTDESSIGLKNVRSFGTEGRKKDGPQIPASDKIYEYILFRGSDIKDLQVKSSPPVQPTPTINNDPAIIQSHYSRPVSSSPSLPSSVSGSLTDINSHTAQFGLPGSNVQGGFPLYQPGGVLGSWGPSPPPPNANGSGLHIPMYWQGYYGPANGLPHIPQQPPLLRPPPGMSIPSPMQQPMHYPSFNDSLPGAPSNLTEVPSSLISASSASSSNLNSTSVFSSTLPSTLSSTIPPVSSTLPSTLSSTIPLVPSTLPSTLSSNVLPVSSTPLASGTLLSGPIKAQNSALSTSNVSASLSSLSPLSASNPEMNPSATSISNKPNTVAGSTFPYQAVSQPLTSVVGTSSSSYTDTRAPSLVTPGQFMQSGSAAIISSLSSQSAEKNEVFQVSSSLAEVMPVSTEPQPPILPLPPSARTVHKPNGASFQPRHGYRGRGQGTGNSRPMTKFTEEFDFMAMNEKFNKDEVWGDLGKGNKPHPKDKDGDRKIIDDVDYQDDDDTEILKVEVKPVYNKDDFFDTLSSNALYQDSQNGRTRYSEQMKIDTETFGEFTRHHGGRGGRGPWRGGRSRGGYYGRGYSYVGRGRGRGRGRAQY